MLKNADFSYIAMKNILKNTDVIIKILAGENLY